jgi:hypothetical protein
MMVNLKSGEGGAQDGITKLQVVDTKTVEKGLIAGSYVLVVWIDIGCKGMMVKFRLGGLSQIRYPSQRKAKFDIFLWARARDPWP